LFELREVSAMIEQSPLTFRISLWRPWLLAISPLALLAAVGIAISGFAGQLATAASILLIFAGVAVILLLPIGLTVSVSQWHVDPNGIGGRNNMLVYNYLNWTEIEAVEPWLIPGYPYLQVNGGGKRPAFWLPLFLTDMPALWTAVARYAPPENPLRRYLEQHLAEPGATADRPRG
jgi:hypothetical protein